MKTLVFQNNKHHQINENSWYDTKKVMVDETSKVLTEPY